MTAGLPSSGVADRMIEKLAPLVPVDELYDYHGAAGVPLWAPYHQGDVFAKVTIEDLPPLEGADEGLVMLFMHPCTMREGVSLRSHLTVVRVKVESPRKVLGDLDRWATRNKVMPLPDLRGDGKSTHIADFMEISTIDSERLPRTNRIAQLSAAGRVHMQHRIVFHLTRYCAHPDSIADATKAVEVEAQMQADWVEAGCRVPEDCGLAAVEALEREFQEFLGSNDDPRSLRSELKDSRQSDAVRSIQQRIRQKSPRTASH